MNYGQEWEKQAKILEEKRQEAIKYLGDKWLLKDGSYSHNIKVLKNHVSKNPQ